jgi:hypothetical protein
VDRQLVRQDVAAPGRLDGVHVADHVGDGHVGRGELLDVAMLPGNPFDRGVVPVLVELQLAEFGDGVERVVVDLRSRQDRNLGIQELDELSEDPTLRLTAQSEQDEVVAGEDRVHDLRHHGVVVSHDAREQGLAVTQLANQVGSELVLHGARDIPRRPQFTKRLRWRSCHLGSFPAWTRLR